MFRIFGSDKPAPVRENLAEATRHARANEMRFTPCPPGSGRVYELKLLQTPEDMPRYKRIATDAYTGLVEPSEEGRILILEVADSEVIVLWTNLAEDRHIFSDVYSRVRNRRLKLTQVYEASPALLDLYMRRLRGSDGHAALAPVSKGATNELFTHMVSDAIRLKASDIHLQVGKEYANILLRVHGELRRQQFIHRSQADALSRAIFALADDDSKPATFDPRDYQDAAVTTSVKIGGADVPFKLRYGSEPVYPDGWDITLRILPLGQDEGERGLPQLGYDEAQDYDINQMLAFPTGAIVLCGPTGSGKSTTIKTLCGMIYDRCAGRKLIRTIEDPPEYIIRGARQTPVVRRKDGPNQGSEFGKALKAAMRGDPDVIMIGEVRDEETARLMQQAVQTGHKVLATVHAGNPFDAIDRFVDLGMRRSVIASDEFMSGIIQQRLLPVLCPHCALPIDEVKEALSPEVLRRINRTSGEHLTSLRFRGLGCDHCSGQGVHNRTVAAEILMFDREIQNLIYKDNPFARAYWRGGFMRDVSRSAGLSKLDHALAKMAKGIVSPLDVEKELGQLDKQESVEKARDWIEKHYTGGSSSPFRREGTHDVG